MGLKTRVVLIGGLTLAIAAVAPAGPPAGGGRSFGGPISGPAPLGASGRAPLGASGSLIRMPSPGRGYNGNRNGGHHGGGTYGRSGRDYRHFPTA